MKLIALILTCGMLLFNCADNKTPSISVTELKKQADQQNPFFLLDVRTMPEYVAGHVTFVSDLIPYDSLSFYVDRLPENKDTTIYCFCRSGRRSAIATEYLRSVGYTKVYNVNGGIIAWQDAGFDIVSGPLQSQ